MKISFSIPAYNEEKRIGPCLEAMQKEIARSGCEAEIIVVNNASTDKTSEIASSFANVCVVDEPMKGLTRARQAGFLASCGELVANVDADTVMPEGWIDTVLKEFARDPKLVALSGPYKFHDLSLFARVLSESFFAFGYITYLVTRFVLHAGSMLQGGNFIVERKAMEHIGGFDTTIEFYGEDTDVARRLSKVGHVKWTFKLPMYTSARRLQHEGMVRMGSRYALNFLWTTFAGKPWSEQYIDVRTDWRE